MFETMIRHACLGLLLFAAGTASAAKDKPQVDLVTGDWEYNSQVQKIADTPLGILFSIEPTICSNILIHLDGCNCDCCQDNPKLAGLLNFSFLKDKEINRRYVVVEFTIRANPGFENEAIPAMCFGVLRSGKSEVKGYAKDFNGMVTVWSNRTFLFETSYPDLRGNIIQYITDSTGIHFAPDFEPMHVRIIFDTVNAREIIVYQNRSWSKYTNLEMPAPDGKIDFRSVGLAIPDGKFSRDFRKRYLEISRPVVRQFGTEKEMDETLEPIEFFPYRYEDLLIGIRAQNSDKRSLIRQARMHKNPDVLYALAMSLLYGKGENCDPDTALELLKEAASKHCHVLAKYELALCYFRGYGVAKNEKTAFSYVEEAMKFRYNKASALYILMRYEQLNRPIFISDAFRDDLKKKIFNDLSNDHDLTMMSDRFKLGTSGAMVDTSPKILSPLDNYFNLSKTDDDNPYAFFEFCIAQGYYPANLQLAIRREFDNQHKIKSCEPATVTQLLDKGAYQGDSDAAIVRLFFRARANQLTEDDFSQEQLLKLMDYPEYYLLKFLYQNPDFPAAKQILGGNFESAEQILDKDKRPEAKLLLALMSISKIQYTDCRAFLTPDSAKFRNLVNAAQTNTVAQYFLARAYYNNDMPTDYQKTTGDAARQYQTENLLKRAADADFLPAQYLQLEVELDGKVGNADQFLARVQKFCDLDYAPAFILKARALQKFKRIDEAKQIYREAAKKGNADACYELAVLSPDDASLWEQYIKADMARRSLDKADFFYPQKYYYEWVATNLAAPWSDEMLSDMQKEYKSLYNKLSDAYQDGKKNSKVTKKDRGQVRGTIYEKNKIIQPTKKPQRQQQFIDNQL